MKFPEAVTHEFGCFLHVADLDFYFSVVNYYLNNVHDPYNHHIRLGDRIFKFWSKQGGLINPKTKKLSFEYMLQWTDAEGASKCTYTIKPLFGSGTKTKTGKLLNLSTVGTQIHIQSSYIDLDEHFDIVFELMDYLGSSRFHSKIDRSISRIYQMARHVRYHERHEYNLVSMLQAIEQESSMLGDSKIVKVLESGKYNMYKLDNPNYSVCGLYPRWCYSVKSYRITNFLSRAPEDSLRHPKLEVFLKSDVHQNPSISDYLELKKDLDKVLYSLLGFLAEPIEYVSDNYFNIEKVFEYRYNLPIWDYKKIPAVSFELDPHENINAVKVLAFLSLQSEGCSSFQDIHEATEIPKRTLWRYVNHWKSEGFLDTVRQSITYVFFRSKSFFEQAKTVLVDFCSIFKIGFKKLYGDVFVDLGMIRPYRERSKNLKPIASYKPRKLDPIIVETFQQGKSLLKEFKELGISRTVGVISNHNTMRYSRVL